MLNIVTMYAMEKVSSFPKTLKTLLFSLAVSDVGVDRFTCSVSLHNTSSKAVTTEQSQL